MIQISISPDMLGNYTKWLEENVGVGCQAWTFEFTYRRHDWYWDTISFPGRTIIGLRDQDATAFKLRFGIRE
jgi:hypothetical protein